MNNSLVKILIEAKKLNKWIPAKFLVKYGIQSVNLSKLEDEGIILTMKSKSDGLVLKLTLKGYHHFNK
ncbi:hypothetical protein DTX80_11830 [Bacilli bacterium]|nr:hypothetical protein WH51_13380 [Bacilli bacterium VT-13-104]PZD84863.1 hypothetical protein DEJ64_11035 [Bacilli bacterium]PZD86366.1 hypothetical protein DEJ60_10770 [Bacilli bacterium]PZD89844.1 hypothetical protein DEJ66_11090 [Bacilli bacterium]RCO05354.1 hypothetical protein DTX80_11830 [Bacilli bacterium]